jgi:hypothetical protein
LENLNEHQKKELANKAVLALISLTSVFKINGIEELIATNIMDRVDGDSYKGLDFISKVKKNIESLEESIDLRV